MAIPSRTSRSSTTLRCGVRWKSSRGCNLEFDSFDQKPKQPDDAGSKTPGGAGTHTRQTHEPHEPTSKPTPATDSCARPHCQPRNARVITNHTTQPMKLGNNCRRTPEFAPTDCQKLLVRRVAAALYTSNFRRRRRRNRDFVLFCRPHDVIGSLCRARSLLRGRLPRSNSTPSLQQRPPPAKRAHVQCNISTTKVSRGATL